MTVLRVYFTSKTIVDVPFHVQQLEMWCSDDKQKYNSYGTTTIPDDVYIESIEEDKEYNCITIKMTDETKLWTYKVGYFKTECYEGVLPSTRVELVSGVDHVLPGMYTVDEMARLDNILQWNPKVLQTVDIP